MGENHGNWALVLGDGKPGHENQSLGILPPDISPWMFRPRFKSRFAWLRSWFAARFPVPLGNSVGPFPWHRVIDNGAELADRLGAEPPPALVVSAGSGPAPMTLLLARHLTLPAATCMTPSVGLVRFNLACVPRHDRYRNSTRALTTIGAPNRIEETALMAEATRFKKNHGLKNSRYISLLLGGDAPRHAISPELGARIYDGCAQLAKSHKAGLLVTTSRRTRLQTEDRIADKTAAAYLCRGRTDDEYPVPGMLGLSDLAVVTEDSVSMVSEAATAPCRVLSVAVERRGRTPQRHERVLRELAAEGYIRRTTPERLTEDGASLLSGPPPPALDDSRRCREAVAKLVAS